MKGRIVERSPALRALEHRGDVRERQISGNARDERVISLFAGPGLGQERAAFDLPNPHPDAARGEVALDELLDRVVARSDREELEVERSATARTDAIGSAPP